MSENYLDLGRPLRQAMIFAAQVVHVLITIWLFYGFAGIDRLVHSV